MVKVDRPPPEEDNPAQDIVDMLGGITAYIKKIKV